jgi:hypothetical protein
MLYTMMKIFFYDDTFFINIIYGFSELFCVYKFLTNILLLYLFFMIVTFYDYFFFLLSGDDNMIYLFFF